MSNIKQIIANNVFTIRTENQLTQKEFANKLGISRSLVSKIEHALHVPSSDILKMISDEFHVSADWLLQTHYFENTPSALSIDAVDIALSFEKLPDESKRILKDLVSVMLRNR